MTMTLMVDVVVAVLLVSVIAYAMVLNRRLGALRADRHQFEGIIRSLQDTSMRAEAGIAQLKTAAEQSGRQLQQKVELGQALREDLSYMIDRGNGLADRLEGAIRSGRDDTRGMPAEPAAETPATPGNRLRDLLRRIDASAPPGAAAPPVADEAAPRIAGFPSRAERDLRRALDAKR
jgi:uncharacterized protein DUF6468